MLYILCGLPFAGKTTLAQKLIEKYKWEFVGIDEINRERGVGLDTTIPITPSEWDMTYRLTEEKTKKLLQEGKTVIYDATNFTFEQRQRLRDIAENIGTTSQVLYIATPKGDVIKRWMENKKSGQRNDVREEDFMHVISCFEVPRPEERAIIYYNGDALPI